MTRAPLAGGGALDEEPIVNRLPPLELVGVDGVNVGAGLALPPPNENPLPEEGRPVVLVAGEAG